jgi:hypothetical protein
MKTFCLKWFDLTKWLDKYSLLLLKMAVEAKGIRFAQSYKTPMSSGSQISATLVLAAKDFTLGTNFC